ncbi:restriction endonuclease [Catenulispora subtropica]|uniref:nSTAND3 domain-containing NTPase n=1 Tax=Catenulispora subtropica TaxID=450798 RepID=UPI0031D7A755
MRDFTVVSDREFEELVADLLQAELDTHVERFPPGRDGGVDLQWRLGEETVIGQCKHYARSGYSKLLRELRREAEKVSKNKPDDYWVVTSVDLTGRQKKEIHELFQPWMRSPGNVLGARDLDGMLTRFPAVERRHIKLLFSTGEQLTTLVHAGIVNRTRAFQKRIERARPAYAVTQAHHEATDLLKKHRVCVIVGPPGIGKTSLGMMLVAQAIGDGYQPVEVSEDIHDAFAMLREDEKQVFFYDDFLGELSYAEHLGRKNEQRRIEEFIEEVVHSSTALLVMTSREYILRDARRMHDPVGRIAAKPFVVRLAQFPLPDAARVLYNHLWHASLPGPALGDLANDGWMRIAGHHGFNPRVVDWCVQSEFVGDGRHYVSRVVAALDNPETIWETTFNGLREFDRLLLYVLSTLHGNFSTVEEACAILDALCRETGLRFTESELHRALDVLEGTFTNVEMATHWSSGQQKTVREVRFMNPSIRAFVLRRIAADVSVCRNVLRTATDLNALELLWFGDEQGLIDGRRQWSSRLSPQVREAFVAAAQRVTAQSQRYYRAILFWNCMLPAWRPDREWLTQVVEAHIVELSTDDDEDTVDPYPYNSVLAELRGTDVGKRLHACVDAKTNVDFFDDYLDTWDRLAEHIRAHRSDCELAGSARVQEAFEDFVVGELEYLAETSNEPDVDRLLEVASIADILSPPALQQRLREALQRAKTSDSGRDSQQAPASVKISWDGNLLQDFERLLRPEPPEPHDCEIQ